MSNQDGNNSGKSSDLRSRFNRSNQLNLVTEPSAYGKRNSSSRMSEEQSESMLDTINASVKDSQKAKGIRKKSNSNKSIDEAIEKARNKSYDMKRNFVKRQSFIDLHNHIEKCSKEKMKPPSKQNAKFYCKDHLKRYISD